MTTTTVDITPGASWAADLIRKLGAQKLADEPTNPGLAGAYVEAANEIDRALRRAIRDEARAAQADLLTPAAE